MARQTIRIHGLRQLNRAFRDLDKDLAKDVRRELIAAADPVQQTAHGYALERIRNITEPWARFRIGATQTLVYVAPKERGRARGRQRRQNFATLLAERAMEPALADNQQQITARVWAVIERMVRRAGF